MKKAQLMSQPFYYIFIIIVIALVLVFGYRMINNLLNLQEQSKFVQFREDFKKEVNDVYTKNPGTRISQELLIPKDLKEVCFKQFQTYTKVSASPYNSFNVDSLIPLNDNYCLKVNNNKLSFTLENKILNQKTIVEVS